MVFLLDGTNPKGSFQLPPPNYTQLAGLVRVELHPWKPAQNLPPPENWNCKHTHNPPPFYSPVPGETSQEVKIKRAMTNQEIIFSPASVPPVVCLLIMQCVLQQEHYRNRIAYA